MPLVRPERRARLVAAALLAFLTIDGFLIASQSAAMAQSKPDTSDDPATSKSQPKSKDGRKAKARVRRDPAGFYMGRRIAEVMSWEGAEWLFRETRVEEEQPEAMLDALKIPRGATVADVGAGAGYHSIRLARRVGSRGIVLATDLQPQMLEMLKNNAREAGVANVKPIRATQTDTKLPEAKVDLILMVDVYHECSDPETTLQGLKKALKPLGRLVLVEFRGEDPEVPIKPEHKMTVDQVRLEVEAAGFVFKDSLEFLPWQHVIIFEKPVESGKDARPGTETLPADSPKTKTKAQ